MNVEHEREQNRFVVRLDGGPAVVEYVPIEGGDWDLVRTFVPESQRQRGIASRLVGHVLDRAADEGRKVVPSCSFVADFIERNGTYRRLLAEEEE